MAEMTKHERVKAALAGAVVDSVPASVWFHFSEDHIAGSPLEEARAHASHFRRCDLDYLKVMNDNPYDMPSDFPVVETVDDWARLEPLSARAPGFAAQLETLRILRDQLGDIYMTSTVFGPFAQANKICNRDLLRHVSENREKVKIGLKAVTASLCVLAAETVKAGANGIFLACSGSAEGELSEEDYRELIRPLDVEVLAAATDGDFNLVHVHGSGCPFNVFADYPADAVNWTSAGSPPDLAAAKSLTEMCLVGGWDQEGPVAEGDIEGIRRETRNALDATAGWRFMFGPGCTIATGTPQDYVRTAIQLARETSARE